MEQLFERGVIPQQTVDDARTAREIAQAETESAAFNLALTEIHATQDGQVLQRLAEPSEIVQPGQAIIKVSGNASGWLLQLNLSDREIVELTHLNSIDVYFDALPGTAFAADISRIAGEANPATAMFAVELRLIDPDPRLRTGMLGTAFLTVVSPQRGLLIPVSALIAADREQGTLFVVENDTALKRQVTLGELRSTGVIVTAGLSNNDIVITGGARYVDDGAKIRVLED